MVKTRGGKEFVFSPLLQGRTAKCMTTLPGTFKRKKRKHTLNTRSSRKNSQKVRCEELLTEEACSKPAPSESVQTRGRRTKVTCRDFGPDRESKYPGFFFCHNCKMAEEALISVRRSKTDMLLSCKKYECKASHTSHFNPTTPKRVCIQDIWPEHKK